MRDKGVRWSLANSVQVCVTNNEFIETIELLGEDANVFMKRGDTVLFYGLKVQEYRKERMLQTTPSEPCAH